MHVAGNAGAVTVMILLFGWPVVLLVPLVGWARWHIRAHTLAQVVATTLISVAVSVAAFRLFGAL